MLILKCYKQLAHNSILYDQDNEVRKSDAKHVVIFPAVACYASTINALLWSDYYRHPTKSG